ncbi:hypothetical protein PPYR_04764 [Photinus pyralis]|uniref:Uncharacterized protein n=1 Tax=Photinus pyralis TaxID=7054 RepID=A0A5N4AZ88_PHOPY|nr:uncharacterized protein LOC116164308 [Photinus pyralis]XP_031334321.1 uncharacterized protein LOC116164308 [Photinus pyralis]XP_031334322.1 uncharacterized protein LOC116164308 [Photinus pyralis]XP_031354745.1 uncharacterized protein LOC116179171 isoform X1 [Photinus pyralis]XP_031354746.1 uncharacterized protein LOC116179171 isoform X1 [Photinus pyralis]KAB0802578.1 hypothetical protein PPYR_04764 [Photinus pyralis]
MQIAIMSAAKRVKLSTKKSAPKASGSSSTTTVPKNTKTAEKPLPQEAIINLVDEDGPTERITTTTTHLRNSAFNTLDELLDQLDGNIHHVYAPQRVDNNIKGTVNNMQHYQTTTSLQPAQTAPQSTSYQLQVDNNIKGTINNMQHYQTTTSLQPAQTAPQSTSYQLHIPEGTARVLQHIIIPPPPPPAEPQLQGAQQQTSTVGQSQHAQKDMKLLREVFEQSFYETISQPPSETGEIIPPIQLPTAVVPSWIEPATPRELAKASLAWLQQKAPEYMQRYEDAQKATRRLEEELDAARLTERRLGEEMTYMNKFINFLK